LRLVDCVAIGINGIVGSGIFFLTSDIGGAAGMFAPTAFVATGLLCLMVALCFAEVASLFEASGGPYLYAREAFGESFAALVGGMAFVATSLGFASGARKLGEEVGGLFGLAPGPGTIGVSFAIMGTLALMNVRGVRVGAVASNVFTVVKLVPLVLFVLAGLFLSDPAVRDAQPVPTVEGFGFAMLLAVFTYTGFEFVSIVAGETENPKRDVPLAITGALTGAVVLYALVAWVLGGLLARPGEVQGGAIAAAAEVMGGADAGRAIRWCAIASMTGFVSGSALVGPRIVSSLAQGGGLPAFLGRVSADGVPKIAIVSLTGAAMLLVAALPFESLADLTVVTVFFEFTPTLVALIVFRRTRPDAPRTVRVPGGPVVAVACVGLMVLLLTQARPGDLKFGGWIFAAVVLLAGANVAMRRRRA